MSDLLLHHVSYPVRDLSASLTFYRDIFGLEPLPRPDMGVDGVWLACGDREIHLVLNRESGTFRDGKPINPADVHFAFRTVDFDAMVAKLEQRGFSPALPPADPRHILVMRDSVAGFAQLYLRDPDNHTIEVNAKAM